MIGECDFLFYSADKATTYKVVIEGLTEEGEMVYETREFEIKWNNKFKVENKMWW